MSGKRGKGCSNSSSLIFGSSKQFGSSKGQVTVFIIVGIVFLFLFAGVLYVTRTVTTEKTFIEGEPAIASAPQEFRPLQAYTENCLYQIGKRGLQILGQQGGYIYPELVGKFSVSDPTNSDGLDLEPLKIPYWHYNALPNSANSVAYASLQPKLYTKDDPSLSVEAQLGRFVDEKLNSCLNRYVPFEQQGYQVNFDDAGKKTTVRVTEENVLFLLDMDLRAKRGDAEASLDQFYVKIPLPLKKYYDVAEEIAKSQKNYTFLERQALDLIQSFSTVDPNKLPPTSTMRFELVPEVSWSAADVKRKIKEMLTSYVPLLQTVGSTALYRYEYPVSDLSGLYQKTYDNMILPLVNVAGLRTSFDYFGWEPYLRINAGGNTIEPDHMAVNYWLLHFGTQHYYAVYDLSYPVLVTLVDDKALDGEGYTFLFALESNVRHNNPAEADKILKEPTASFSQSLICNENQKSTELIKTIVVDSFTKEPLEAVQLSFSIPEQDTCLIGSTDKKGVVAEKYPAVYGGTMSLIKQDYLTNFYPLDTYKYKKSSAVIGYAVSGLREPVIEMHQFKPINIKVKKKLLQKCISGTSAELKKDWTWVTGVPIVTLGSEGYCFTDGMLPLKKDPVYSFVPELRKEEHSWHYTGVTRDLSENEQGTISLIRVADLQEGLFGDSWAVAASVRGREEMEVQLVPGIYEVSGLVMLEQEVLIPEEERCSDGVMEAIGCGDIKGCCVNFDETRMAQFMSGQLSWDEKKYYLRITPENLYNSGTLTFYFPTIDITKVPAEEHQRVIEDLQMIGELESVSQKFRAKLEPTYS